MRLNLSEVLSDLIEAYEAWNDHEPEPTILVSERAVTITAATGLLWHCREWMPNRLRRSVLDHIARGEPAHTETSLATYAQAARIMRRRIREAAAI